ncbi:MAG: antitoxin Xre-like helix-turn-helix domain-containing protein, partial [Rhodanobacter sp.]
MTARPTRVTENQARNTESADTLAAPALRAFFRLAEHWNLRATEQRCLLGEPPESTFYKWKREQDGNLG